MSMLPPADLRDRHLRILGLSLTFALPAGLTALMICLCWTLYISLFLTSFTGNRPSANMNILTHGIPLVVYLVQHPNKTLLTIMAAIFFYATVRSCWTAFREIRDYAAYFADDQEAESRIWRYMFTRRCGISALTVVIWAIPVTFFVGAFCVWGMLTARSASIPSWMFWFHPFSFDGEAKRFAEIEERRRLELERIQQPASRQEPPANQDAPRVKRRW